MVATQMFDSSTKPVSISRRYRLFSPWNANDTSNSPARPQAQVTSSSTPLKFGNTRSSFFS